MLLPLPLTLSLFLSTPMGGILPALPDLPSLDEILPALEGVLPSLDTVLQREGRLKALDTTTRTSRSPEGLDGGTNYTPGTYTNVPLTGANEGSGAKATIVVSEDGSVGSVTLTAFGRNYSATDQLTADPAALGGGDGFSVDVAGVASTLPSLSDVLPVLGELTDVLPTLDPCYSNDPVTGECRPGYR